MVKVQKPKANKKQVDHVDDEEEMFPPDHSDWPIRVQGRLGLTGSKTGKGYNVQKEEIERRMGQPEHLSRSAVCQYLKRRRQAALLPMDLILPEKKAKTKNSLFTLLTEGEARDLARDFGKITREEGFFTSLTQSIDPDQREAVRDSANCLMDALDNIDQYTCKASLRQHGFLIPAVREVFRQLSDI